MSDTKTDEVGLFGALRQAATWAAVGAALGFALVGLFGLVYCLLWGICHGDPGCDAALSLSFAMTGAAAGGVTALAGWFIDGDNPLAPDDEPPQWDTAEERPSCKSQCLSCRLHDRRRPPSNGKPLKLT